MMVVESLEIGKTFLKTIFFILERNFLRMSSENNIDPEIIPNKEFNILHFIQNFKCNLKNVVIIVLGVIILVLAIYTIFTKFNEESKEDVAIEWIFERCVVRV